MSKKCKPLCHEAHFEVKSVKNRRPRTTFGSSDVVSCGRCKGFFSLSKRVFVAFPKTNGRRGTSEEDLERCISRGRRSTRDMLLRDIKRSGH